MFFDRLFSVEKLRSRARLSPCFLLVPFFFLKPGNRTVTLPSSC